MTAYADVAAIATDPGFLDRVKAALYVKAVDVLAIYNSDETAAAYATNRTGDVLWSQNDDTVGTFAWILAARQGIVADPAVSTDEDIRSAIDAVWLPLCGFPAQPPA